MSFINETQMNKWMLEEFSMQITNLPGSPPLPESNVELIIQ